MQVDFTTIKRGKRKLKGFVATLGYSRACYVWFSEHEKQEDWLNGIEAAFDFFGGVTKEVLFDNAKCIMIERDAYGDGHHHWNSKLLEQAKNYGYRAKAYRPYRAKTKGKVERFNGYLKSSFITPLAASLKQAGLELDIDIANGQIGPWLHDVAHQRIHGTTKQTPASLLIKEQTHLLPLPSKGSMVEAPRSNKNTPVPVESFQHPLSIYDSFIEVRL